MKRSIVVLSLALAALPLTACVDDGYWGTNGLFFYRSSERKRSYRQGGRDHFRRGGDVQPGGRFRPMQGNTRPPRGARMPHFDSTGSKEDHQGRGSNRDRP